MLLAGVASIGIKKIEFLHTSTVDSQAVAILINSIGLTLFATRQRLSS